MKPEYKYYKRKNIITKDGHTMFLQDAVKDLNCLQRKLELAGEMIGQMSSDMEALESQNEELEDWNKAYKESLRIANETMAKDKAKNKELVEALGEVGKLWCEYKNGRDVEALIDKFFEAEGKKDKQ